MTAPLFLIEPTVAAGAGPGDAVELTGPEGRHAVTVTRIQVGEEIDLADGRGTVLSTTVETITGADSLTARVSDRANVPAPQPRLTVVQALPKGDRGETAVETLAEVGVDVIVPWQADRSIARWSGAKSQKGPAKWASTARTAGKQARRAWFPEVTSLARTADVEERIAAAACAVILHELATTPIQHIAVPAAGEVLLIVGPEGGLTPDEIARFQAAGAQLALVGPTVMRTSTAGTVAAGVVLAATGRWA
jgi:16S rRNA (uracil1498-N3)-methyltransferase